ncbi:phytanoyl-CoA dioxygenase family protein [Cupriavidus pauculus]|uniref:phytanoyl-CoA dioxygenase family protein n=1 Tax=Cupriavidus pauculus TaxID=82633 RepID=UPI0012449DAB|nr:phytanoyl-CoA dioxygenase family protein [Cupriavidus pauculus]KAB0596840.1 phytanoyl-CoA dioxygenase family protein [Cupriavidus pauculus]UAL01828.1 phytanoyl-CoA dioxygenase family protein [Cupriavidus pauculus]
MTASQQRTPGASRSLDFDSSAPLADQAGLASLAREFHGGGYIVLRNFADEATCAALEAVTRQHLAGAVPPVEFEADLGYPGAPATRQAAGGSTVRRLRQAYGRDEVFRRWASHPQVVATVEALLGEPVRLTLAHHNCVMTKHPHYGSQTGWHRDTRYWAFVKPDLVTVWLALGDEDERNGVLRVIPGSHRARLDPAQLDPAEFLVEAHPASQALLKGAMPLALHRGDVLMFDSRLFHAAGRNDSDAVKLSVAFAYFGASNRPLSGTRSAEFGSVEMPPALL